MVAFSKFKVIAFVAATATASETFTGSDAKKLGPPRNYHRYDVPGASPVSGSPFSSTATSLSREERAERMKWFEEAARDMLALPQQASTAGAYHSDTALGHRFTTAMEPNESEDEGEEDSASGSDSGLDTPPRSRPYYSHSEADADATSVSAADADDEDEEDSTVSTRSEERDEMDNLRDEKVQLRTAEGNYRRAYSKHPHSVDWAAFQFEDKYRTYFDEDLIGVQADWKPVFVENQPVWGKLRLGVNPLHQPKLTQKVSTSARDHLAISDKNGEVCKEMWYRRKPERPYSKKWKVFHSMMRNSWPFQMMPIAEKDRYDHMRALEQHEFWFEQSKNLYKFTKEAQELILSDVKNLMCQRDHDMQASRWPYPVTYQYKPLSYTLFKLTTLMQDVLKQPFSTTVIPGRVAQIAGCEVDPVRVELVLNKDRVLKREAKIGYEKHYAMEKRFKKEKKSRFDWDPETHELIDTVKSVANLRFNGVSCKAYVRGSSMPEFPITVNNIVVDMPLHGSYNFMSPRENAVFNLEYAWEDYSSRDSPSMDDLILREVENFEWMRLWGLWFSDAEAVDSFADYQKEAQMWLINERSKTQRTQGRKLKLAEKKYLVAALDMPYELSNSARKNTRHFIDRRDNAETEDYDSYPIVSESGNSGIEIKVPRTLSDKASELRTSKSQLSWMPSNFDVPWRTTNNVGLEAGISKIDEDWADSWPFNFESEAQAADRNTVKEKEFFLFPDVGAEVQDALESRIKEVLHGAHDEGKWMASFSAVLNKDLLPHPYMHPVFRTMLIAN